MILLIIAILSGLLTTIVIRRTTDAEALRSSRNRIHAHLLEFRLFFDEPRLIWQAQMALLRDNVRLLRLLLPPTLILALPMAWLFLQLDTVYGLRPLRPGEPSIVTAQMARPIEASDHFNLRGSDGITVETPPVRVLRDQQVAWRIRPAGNIQGSLKLALNGRDFGKTVTFGDSRAAPSPRRSRSLAEFLLHPEEPRLPDGDIAWIEVAYAEAGPAWIVWFLIISTITAFLSARWIRVRPQKT